MNQLTENLANALRPTPWAYKSDFLNCAVSVSLATFLGGEPALTLEDALMILFANYTPLMEAINDDEFECLDQAVLVALFLPEKAKEADKWIGSQFSDDETASEAVADWFGSHSELRKLWALRRCSPRPTVN